MDRNNYPEILFTFAGNKGCSMLKERTDMKLGTQICTTIEQSERLTAIGVKDETSDLIYKHRRKVWPMWTLHRLMKILDDPSITIDIQDAYKIVIDLIEAKIKKGELKKEYMNE